MLKIHKENEEKNTTTIKILWLTSRFAAKMGGGGGRGEGYNTPGCCDYIGFGRFLNFCVGGGIKAPNFFKHEPKSESHALQWDWNIIL